MAYQAISSLSAGSTVTASYLNRLADNAEFIYDVMDQGNTPFASYSRESVSSIDETDVLWRFRHRNRYLNYQIWSLGYTHIRIYYNGVQVAGSESPTAGYYTGVADLEDITSWSNYEGGWLITTVYAGGTGEADIVINDGTYYLCTADHTADASNEPGVGGSWTSYWAAIAEPVIGSIYTVHVDIGFDENRVGIVDYLMEGYGL